MQQKSLPHWLLLQKHSCIAAINYFCCCDIFSYGIQKLPEMYIALKIHWLYPRVEDIQTCLT